MYSSHVENKLVNLLFLFVIGLFILTGCAGNKTVNEDENQVTEVDPYENVNRKVYVFNEALDDYVAEPISDAYRWVTPQFVQTGVSNFFNNLKDINVVLNDLMQGKYEQSGHDAGRLLVNSTLGLGGLIDVGTDIGLEKHEEDFAQTLAVWGVPQGPYLVLPILGSMTARGVPGGVFDTAVNPASYVGVPVQVIQMLNARANAQGALRFIDEAALDPYVFTRESFIQYRKNLITDGEGQLEDELIDFEEDFEDQEIEVNSKDPVEQNDNVQNVLNLSAPTTDSQAQESSVD